MKFAHRIILAVALILCGAPALSQAQGVIAIGRAPGTNLPSLFNIDLTSGLEKLIGALGDASTLPYGLALRNGELYTFDANIDRIRRIDPLTGAYLGAPIDIHVGDLTLEGDLSFSFDGFTGLLTTASNATTGAGPSLYKFDLLSGTSTLAGPTLTLSTMEAVVVQGLALSPGGTLYALGRNRDRLYNLNSDTGTLSPVSQSALGVTPTSAFAGITFVGSTMYGVMNDFLYQINPISGVATPIATTGGFTSISGLAQVPEPSAMLFLAASATRLLTRRFRRKM